MLTKVFFCPLSLRTDLSSLSVMFNQSKCVGCSACVKACNNIAGQNVLAIKTIDSKKVVDTKIGVELSKTNCIGCGQCTLVCRPGAITEVDEIPILLESLKNKKGKVFVAQTAPAIRVNLSEIFGFPVGTVTEGKLVASLKKIGFDYVFDTSFAADLTIAEEATEFVERVKKGGVFPMFTSCCPAWVNYVEKSNPQLIPNLSSCKSPMSMLGALIKTDFAKIKKIDPRSIVSVSIMPCTAKKDEARRSELSDESGQNTDIVISTRELARLIKSKKIDYKKIPDQKYDKLYAEYTGGGVIFGSSGGVMEAALRSAYQILTGNPLSQLDILPIRAGKDGIKFSEVHINGSTVKVAVCQGVANAKKLVEKIQKKDPSVADLKFVEVMACPGGCVNGGGSSKAKNAKAVQDRAGALYKLDSNLKQRVSLDNSELKELYRRSLKGFGSHEAHEILHTHFKSKK